uniref:Uncharacterized protein n=1 Tax=Globodera rostochiensis TaxID=31243 RepID=A0A914HSL4_GLORO
MSAAIQLAYVTLRLRNISPTQHFAYKAKRQHFAYKEDPRREKPNAKPQQFEQAKKDVTCEVFVEMGCQCV